MGINEVKPKNHRYDIFSAEFNLEDIGMDMFPNNIEENHGRGQILYVAKELGAKRVYFDSRFQEVTCVKINLKNKDKLLIVLVYRSPSSTELNNTYLNQLVEEASKYESSHLLLLGDFNYGHIDWKACFSDDATEMAFVDQLVDSGLHQNIEEETRHRGQNIPRVLDLVITKEETNIDEIVCKSPLGKSDHSVLVFGYRCYPDKEPAEILIPLHHKANVEKMKEEFLRVRDEFMEFVRDYSPKDI